MTEQIIFATFLIAFGAGLGRALTLRQQYRKTVEGITCLLNADWHVPQVMAARLHQDQELIGKLPALPRSIKRECMEIHSRPKGFKEPVKIWRLR
jgi:hypothetical protein